MVCADGMMVFGTDCYLPIQWLSQHGLEDQVLLLLFVAACVDLLSKLGLSVAVGRAGRVSVCRHMNGGDRGGSRTASRRVSAVLASSLRGGGVSS